MKDWKVMLKLLQATSLFCCQKELYPEQKSESHYIVEHFTYSNKVVEQSVIDVQWEKVSYKNKNEIGNKQLPSSQTPATLAPRNHQSNYGL